MPLKLNAIGLLTGATLVLAQTPVLSTALPLYCKYRPPRGLTPDQEKICAQDPIKAAEEKRKAEELQPPVYPFSQGGFLMVVPSSGQQIGLVLQSKDGSELIFDFARDKSDLSLKPSDIISWKSVNAGSGTDSSGAVSVAVAGALFFWPMMLAAPFMVKNYTITGFQVEYIDNLGRDISLDFATIAGPRPTMELLRFSTGLAAGVRRGAEVIKPLYESGLKQSMLELEALKKPLLVANRQKPWCSYLNLTDNKESAEYRAMIEHVNSLRRKLDMPVMDDVASKSTDQQWDTYLDSRPGLRQWASTYKQQAEALKKC
jgi:hypothetical protein